MSLSTRGTGTRYPVPGYPTFILILCRKKNPKFLCMSFIWPTSAEARTRGRKGGDERNKGKEKEGGKKGRKKIIKNRDRERDFFITRGKKKANAREPSLLRFVCAYRCEGPNMQNCPSGTAIRYAIAVGPSS